MVRYAFKGFSLKSHFKQKYSSVLSCVWVGGGGGGGWSRDLFCSFEKINSLKHLVVIGE